MQNAFLSHLRRWGLYLTGSEVRFSQRARFETKMPDFLGVVQPLLVVPFNFDATGGKSIAAHNLLDDEGNAIVLPDASIILGSLIHVQTTFTSANDSGTIALHANAANDIVTATAISGVGNIWDAGLQVGVPVFTKATAILLTDDRTPKATVAVQALTAGKLRGFLFVLLPSGS